MRERLSFQLNNKHHAWIYKNTNEILLECMRFFFKYPKIEKLTKHNKILVTILAGEMWIESNGFYMVSAIRLKTENIPLKICCEMLV